MIAPNQQPNPENFDLLRMREVRPARWQQAVVAAGLDGSLPQYQFATAEAVEAYFLGEPDPRLVEALQVVNDLGSLRGRDAIIQARRARSVTSAPDAGVVGPAEEALALWIASRGSPAEADVLIIAIVIASRQTQQNLFEFRGRSAKPLVMTPATKGKLDAAVGDFFAAHGMLNGVQITCTQWQGDVIIRILHGERQYVMHEKTPRGTKRQVLIPAAYDLIRYSPSTGVIAIRARTTLIEPYQRLIGLTLFGSADFFDDDALIDLSPLRDAGALRSVQDLDGVLTVVATRLHFSGELGDCTLSGRDCYRQAERGGYAPALASGQLKSVSMSIVFEGGSWRDRCTVRLAPPNIIKISDRSRADQVRAMLRRLQVLRERGPEAAPTAAIAAASLTEQEWMDLFDAKTIARCLEEGLLTRRPMDEIHTTDTVPVTSVRVPGLSTGPKDLEFIEDSARTPRLRDPQRHALYAIDGQAVARAIAQAMGVVEEPKFRADLGVHDIGRRQYPTGQSVHVFLALETLPAAVVTTLNQLAAPGRAVALYPARSAVSDGVSGASLAITLPALEVDDLPYRIMQALQLTKDVCPSYWAPPSHPLVLHGGRKLAWWRRAQLTLKTVEDWDRLLLLAQAQGGLVPHAAIAMHSGSEAKRLINNLEAQLPDELRQAINPKRGSGWSLMAKSLIL